jgi:hypothetical protein
VIAKVIGGLRRTRVTKVTRRALSKTQETRKERVRAKTLRWMLSIPVNKRFHCKLTVWTKLGEIAETRHQSLEAKKKREGNDEA